MGRGGGGVGWGGVGWGRKGGKKGKVIKGLLALVFLYPPGILGTGFLRS